MRKMMLVALAAGVAPVLAGAVTMETMTVGDTNNPADPATGYGSVGYTYRIGKFEVFNSQYVDFLNAVADDDTYGLYDTSMSSNVRGGIDRAGSSGSYIYSVKDNLGDKPVNYVSFYDAVRFVNWLENGQPTGAQGAGTTETGSYTLFTSGSSTTNVSARASGGWVIPTENEWYKAAYYQPAGSGGPSDSYWLYPTRSDSAPTVATASVTGNISNPGANVVNYDFGADWNGQDGNLTTVGSAGALSASYYGTFDQGGNVQEWDEAIISSVYRGLRGGVFNAFENRLRSTDQDYASPLHQESSAGFRVVFLIPEPSSVAALLMVGLGICVRMRNRIRSR